MRRFIILLFFILFVCSAHVTEARKLALLVGVDKYDDISSLTCCVNDMNTLKEALMKIGFAEENIHLLVTRGENIDFPSKRRIERRISEILASAGPRDLVLIAFSGHGAQEGKTVYFCPPEVDLDDLEGTCVSITKVMEDLAMCKAKFKWLVVDACRNDPNQQAKGIGGKGIKVIPSPPEGIALFQSCAKDEESWEDSVSGNSFFTKNFAAALSGEADSDHDGNLTLMEVCKWTINQTNNQVMTTLKKSQKPYITGSVSDFILTKDVNVPKARTLVDEARKAMDDEDYELAIEKFDKALALCPRFELWKRERNYAKRLLDTKPPKPTSWDSFEWDGTKIKKFIGKETRVVIPEGATEIGEGAFGNCSFITSVVIPEGVSKIEYGAFKKCKSLKSVVIPYGVTDIEGYAFEDCNSLISVDIPDSVTRINDCAFSNCISLRSVKISNGVTEINQCMFWGCISLKSVVIPHSVRKIWNSAFACCSNLKEWGISPAHPYLKSDGPGLLTKDGKTLIACPGAETEYRIPEGVISIKANAFANCKSLKSVVIPDSIKDIGDGAFRNCISLTSVAIPEGISRINWSVFEGCKSLTSFVIPDGVTYIGISAFENCSSLKSIAIPESVTEIERDAFNGCSSLMSVVISNGVPKIECRTFAGCKSLTSFSIPKGVSEIRYNAFEGCSSLTSVIIPEGVSKIENNVFKGCSSLKTVVIPNSVKEIEGNVFSYCPALKQLLISSSHNYFTSDGTGLLTKDGKKLIACVGSAKEYRIPRSVSTIEKSAFEGCSSLTSVVIPEGVTKIGWNAFMNCSSLTYFVIPENVTQLEQCMFEGCASLTSVVIPDSVKEIHESAFANCSSLKEWLISPSHPYFKTDGTGLLTKDGKELIACMGSAKEYRIPEGVTTIGYRSFEGCASLTSIFIPQSVKDVSGCAFANCPALKKWSISSSNPYFKSVGIALLTKDGKTLVACPGSEGIYRIPEGVSVIGYSAFSNCSSLSSVVIPESVTEILDNAFEGCSSLKTVVIPKDVKKIGRCAISGCTSLATIIIPEGVIEIEPQGNCPNLTIHAPKGSEAEKYAKEHNIPFQVK